MVYNALEITDAKNKSTEKYTKEQDRCYYWYVDKPY